MAHQVESMFSANQVTPWHGLGKIVSSVDTIEEGIKLAGLDWSVGLQPLYREVNEGFEQVSEGQLVVRETDNSILGLVGPRYTPLQNQEKFEFFQPFLDAGEASLETAGSLSDGRKTWILAKLNRANSKIAKGDEVAKFLLLSDSYDGTMAVRVAFTPIRVVCANTLAMAHRNDGTNQFVRINHTKHVKVALDAIQDIVNTANQEFEATAEQYRFLASKRANMNDMSKYVKQVLGLDKKEKEGGKKGLSTKSLNIIEKVFNCYEYGVGQDVKSIDGTWWKCYNGLTNYLNYEYGHNQGSRMNGLWFGQTVALNKKALELATEFASAA